MTEVDPTLPPGLEYPEHWEADVVLRDGRTAHLRPIMPTDAEGLVEFYVEVSDQSKYFRFFAPMPQLSEKDLSAPTLAESSARGLLPRFDEVTAYVESLRR